MVDTDIVSRVSDDSWVQVRARTEQRNPRTVDIDLVDTLDLLTAINAEDALVPGAVATALPVLADVVDAAVAVVSAGGRVHYAGAGTSGRLGVMDAAELGPTYRIGGDMFDAHHAGGVQALTRAVERVEDDEAHGVADLAHVRTGDLVVGITASGRTPYVAGVLHRAAEIGAATALVSSNPQAPLAELVRWHICVDTGPEAITGSTRMKAATAAKLVLHSLSTAVAIRLGRTWSNLMVDLVATNAKLRGRSVAILQEASGASFDECVRVLDDADGEVKTALVCLLADRTVAEARGRLAAAGGRVRDALG